MSWQTDSVYDDGNKSTPQTEVHHKSWTQITATQVSTTAEQRSGFHVVFVLSFPSSKAGSPPLQRIADSKAISEWAWMNLNLLNVLFDERGGDVGKMTIFAGVEEAAADMQL